MGVCAAYSKVNFLLAARKLPSRWSPKAYFQAFKIFLKLLFKLSFELLVNLSALSSPLDSNRALGFAFQSL